MGCAEWVNGSSNRTFSGSTWDVVRMMLGEFLGTAILCFLGLATCLRWTDAPGNPVQIAFGFGLAITGVIYMMGPISGAHINPSITLASMLSGRINATKGLLYIFFQCLGAIAGSGCLYLIQVDENVDHTSFGLTLPHSKMSLSQAVFTELFLTFIFVMVFLSITDENWNNVKGSASLAIGFTATACHLGFVNSTGTSINPARSLGAAVIMNYYHHLWIYWLGPLAGAGIAAFVYKVLIYVPKEPIIIEKPVSEATETEGNGDVNNIYDDDDQFEEIVINDPPPTQPQISNPTQTTNSPPSTQAQAQIQQSGQDQPSGQDQLIKRPNRR